MKSDGNGISSLGLITLGSALLLSAGCVTGGSGDNAVISEQPQQAIEHTGEAEVAAAGPNELELEVFHIPGVREPDAVWQVPVPIASKEVERSGRLALPDSPAFTTPESPISDQEGQESPDAGEPREQRPDPPLLAHEVTPLPPDALEEHLPLPSIVMRPDREQSPPAGRSSDETRVEEPNPAPTEPLPTGSSGPEPEPGPGPGAVQEDSSAQRRVDPGETFRITLPGRSWVYLGGGDDYDFIGRASEGENTAFSFRGSSRPRDEPRTLVFESRNLITGARSRHEEQVRIVPPETEDSPETRSPGVTSESGAGSATMSLPEGTATALSQLSNASDGELLRRVDQLHDSEDYRSARGLLEEMRAAGVGGRDEVLFRLARVFETQWEGRDLRVARDLYKIVVDEHPLSRRRRQARERIEYINRYFFYIR